MNHREIILKELPGILDLLGIHTGRVLEIGQGNDTMFRKLFESRGMEYFATDTLYGSNNEGLILSGPEYFNYSMQDLSFFKDNEFDLVFSSHTLEHSIDPITALKEMKRIIKPKGKMIAITPWPCKHHILDKDHDHYFVLNRFQLTRLLITAGYIGIIVHEQTPMEVKEQDFNIISVGEKNG